MEKKDKTYVEAVKYMPYATAQEKISAMEGKTRSTDNVMMVPSFSRAMISTMKGGKSNLNVNAKIAKQTTIQMVAAHV